MPAAGKNKGDEGTDNNADEEKAKQIKEPHENDVLCGRGGSINAHVGNERFRTLVERRKRVYLTARFKREKRLIASSIVSEIRELNPPGRFLSRNSKTGLWYDIGDEKARDKTSQALRENAPSIRAEIETEIIEQRAEIQRAEREDCRTTVNQAQQYPQGAWGGYFSYYVYAQHPHGPPAHPPPPHGHAGHHLPQPPPPTHPGQAQPYHAAPPPPPPSGPWPPQTLSAPPPQTLSAPPPQTLSAPPPTRSARHPHHQGQHQLPNGDNAGEHKYASDYLRQPPARTSNNETYPDDDDDQRSVLSDFVSSVVPASLQAWTKSSFSFGAMSVSSDPNEDSPNKPIVYVHQNEEAPRRAVHFKDDKSVANRHRQPKVMHSSSVWRTARPRRKHGSNASVPNGRSANDVAVSEAPVNVHYAEGDNDGMISLITTEGIDSIAEENPARFEALQKQQEQKQAARFPGDYKEDDFASTEPIPFDARMRASEPEPEQPDDATFMSGSLLSLMANSISTSIFGSTLGSVDMSSRIHNAQSGNGNRVPKEIKKQDDDLAMECEGQEVQLMEQVDHAGMAEERRFPSQDAGRVPVDWPSRVGSCHNWMPDTLGSAHSFFSHQSKDVSPVGSMDLDTSLNIDPQSYGGSIGSTSYSRVFESDGMSSELSRERRPNLSARPVARLPSFDRSLRGRNDLTNPISGVDESLLSKGSDKIADNLSPMGTPNDGQSGMTWENYKE